MDPKALSSTAINILGEELAKVDGRFKLGSREQKDCHEFGILSNAIKYIQDPEENEDLRNSAEEAIRLTMQELGKEGLLDQITGTVEQRENGFQTSENGRKSRVLSNLYHLLFN
ncbi:hypothetical protein HYZ70_02465 [Candidatus Curtissbacteria bacterium]|nr:hypothetical protein [Candidatus Curtissbacteria bacterium]